MMKALIYCRVSSQRQVNEGHGNESQEKRCRDYALSKGYTVVKVFLDNGVSGKLLDRPALIDMLHYVDEHSDDTFVVIFDDLSRFARDLEVHIKLRTEFATRGLTRECLNFTFDESPEGEYAEMILAAGNQYFRKSNRRQVIQKQKARLESGYWAFSTPRALESVRDPIHGKILVPREPYASIYKSAIVLYRDGVLQRLQDVKDYIDKEYITLGLSKGISLTAARDLLSQILYCGYLEYIPWGVERRIALHEGFISLDTFNRVQERLEGRTKPWNRRDKSIDFPLRPHVLCASCNTPITASWTKGRSKRYPNYFCRNKDCKYKWKVIRKEKFESEFETLLAEVEPRSELIDLAGEILHEQWNVRLEQHTVYRSTLKSQLKEVSSGIDSYLNRLQRTRDNQVAEMYEGEILKLKKKKDQIESELSKELYTSKEFGTAVDKVFGILKKPMAMWKSDDLSDKKTIIMMYFGEQLKYDYENGFGSASLAYPIKLIGRIARPINGNVEMSGCDPESEMAK